MVSSKNDDQPWPHLARSIALTACRTALGQGFPACGGAAKVEHQVPRQGLNKFDYWYRSPTEYEALRYRTRRILIERAAVRWVGFALNAILVSILTLVPNPGSYVGLS